MENEQQSTLSPEPTIEEQETDVVVATPPSPRFPFDLSWKVWVLGAAGVVLGIGIIWAIASPKSETTSQEATTEQARITVKTIPVKNEAIRSWTFGDGYVSALVKKHLTFQAEGTINYLRQVGGRDLREGDFVRQGELLAQVDRRKYDADITVATTGKIEANNQVQNAIASLKQAEASLVQVKADLERAKTNEEFAETDLKRYEDLLEEGAIEERAVDVRVTDLKNARASTKAAIAAVESTEAQVAAARTQVDTAEAGIRSADARLSQSTINSEDTQLIAPFDGVIARLNIRQGDYWTPQIINAGGDYDTIVERLPIIMIDPTQFEVNVELPAYQGEEVQPGQQALIILDGDRSQVNANNFTGQDLNTLASARGRVFSVSPSVSPGERSIRVTIRIESGGATLQDGQSVSAWIATETKPSAAVAPFSAFIFRDRRPYVFVVNESDNTVEQRQIQPGIEGLSKREIIKGVRPGELLVVEGQNRLVNGAPVEVLSDF
ncbi:efflux transporter, RND family, MFP subunit [[Leptolyngbya] sp. PCC 7376]|uniref:efflux RND transporter periplasmic adaptor subunit n=1 Tax=[Leptolyngbya] sp. PCC 7376 TaxID=111781 RepID=UPI00029ED5D6|nr:efflux RND transporter periplasmic adaptor subunit [[Leptolyngbya] sp. PCC 7376]AFY39786.1 efflux transporter, RND family, MFP subunit [[Leptolyngbya] sp. PCC 7376]